MHVDGTSRSFDPLAAPAVAFSLLTYVNCILINGEEIPCQQKTAQERSHRQLEWLVA